jgi:hypothetical protein
MTATDILREAGIDIPEVTAYDEMTPPGRDLYAHWEEVVDQADIAIIAIAKEAAKWRWVAERMEGYYEGTADVWGNALARYESEHTDGP